jgi:predicted DNA binding CopG/RHH family protein
MIWFESSNKIVLKERYYSPKIIKTLENCSESFFSKLCDDEKTRLIKRELIKLGQDVFNFKVYANKLTDEDIKEVNHNFVNREWLYDIHWYIEKGHCYKTLKLVLAVECEWGRWRKGDDKNIKELDYAEVKYDFQKLLVCNANLRLFIFHIRNAKDFESLNEYFEDAIETYTNLEQGAKFLFAAYYNKYKNKKLYFSYYSKKTKMLKLDKDEKELLKSFEKGEWKQIKGFKKKKAKYIQIAKNTSAKNKRINIRLSEKDLANLKVKSLEEGMPYQTLVSSIIHKYVSGKFREGA